MKRIIIGTAIGFVGAIPFLLLAVSAIESWLGEYSLPLEIHKDLLIVGGIVFVGGFAIREWGGRIKRKQEKEA